MALIGQGAVPIGIDYSGYADAAWRSASATSGAVAQIGAKLEGLIEEKKKQKDTVKVSADKIDAAIKLFGDQNGALVGISEQLRDEEIPLSERAALGAQIGDFINMGVERMKYADDRAMQERQMQMAEQEFGLSVRGKEMELASLEEAKAEQERITEFAARPMLENVLRQTVEAEQRGERPLIDSERLKVAFLKSPKEQAQIAATALQGLPKAQPVELRDIEFTRDGQAMKGTAVFDPKAGAFQLVPIQDPTAAAVIETLPQGLEPYIGDFEAAGAKYGVDPKVLAAISMHETANGTSSAFRNKSNAMGISNAFGPVEMESVAASIDKMARLLGSTQSGPYKNAQTIEEIAKIYAPIGAGNDPRGLNKHWVQGVKKNLEKLGGNPAAPVRIQPGAAKATSTKTPTEQAIDEARLAKTKAEVANQEKQAQAGGQSQSASIAAAEQTIAIIDELPKMEGFDAAVGSGLGKTIMPWREKGLEGSSRRDVEEKIAQLKGGAFLAAIQQMKGMGALSNAEGDKAAAAIAALDPGQSEESFKKNLLEYRAIIEKGLQKMRQGGAVSTAPSAPTIQQKTDRLLNMIPTE